MKRRQELMAQLDALTKGRDCLDDLRKKYHGGRSSDNMAMLTPPAESTEDVAMTDLPYR